MTTSIRKIAQKAGVSVAAVSMALTDRPNISEARRRQIKQIAQRLGYKPNLLARSFRTRKSFSLGFICGEMHTPYFAELTSILYQEAESRGYSMLITLTEWNSEKQLAQLQMLLQRRVDGVILFPCHQLGPGDRQYEMILKEKYPLVVLDERLEGLPCVYHELQPGMNEAVGHLENKGHERIGFIGQNNLDKVSDKKRLAFLESTSRRKREIYEYDCGKTFEEARRLGRQIGREANRPGGLIVYSDYIAMGIIHGLGDERVRVPEDLAVIGIDGTEMGLAFQPSLTSIYKDRRQMAKSAIDLLLNLVEGKTEVQQTVSLPSTLIIRDSA
jgi:LacI family transcriptional regulator